MEANFVITPLTAAMLHEVAPLFEMQLSEHNVPRSLDELVQGLQIVLTQPEQGFVLVAVSNEKPIGVAYAPRFLSLEHGGWSGWLDELYVLPEWRGHGIGTSLLEAAVTTATERGWAALDLEVDLSHKRVIHLYKRNGFEQVNRTRFVRRLR